VAVMLRDEKRNEHVHTCEALDMKCPAEMYTPATRRYRALPELTYRPYHPRHPLRSYPSAIAKN
jgi:hypothetical protein